MADNEPAPAARLSENLTWRRSVSSGSSVWLSGGGGLTLFSPVELICDLGLTGFCLVARRRPRIYRRDLIDGMCSGAVRVER
jgi:hypothetical protein